MNVLALRRRPNLWKGVTAGLIGGLVGSWTMNQFQSAWTKVWEKLQSDGNSNRQKQDSPKHKESHEESEDATQKAANKIARELIGRSLSQQEKKIAGPILHYAFGATMGGAYGAAVEYEPKVRYGAGVPLGTLLFLAADEAAVPALGLSQAPTKYPWKSHAYAFAAHAVYGTTTELVRSYVRKLLRRL